MCVCACACACACACVSVSVSVSVCVSVCVYVHPAVFGMKDELLKIKQLGLLYMLGRCVCMCVCVHLFVSISNFSAYAIQYSPFSTHLYSGPWLGWFDAVLKSTTPQVHAKHCRDM